MDNHPITPTPSADELSLSDRDDLDQVCGGATRSQQVLDGLKRTDGGFDGIGTDSLIGSPTFTGTHNGVEHVTGKWDANNPWGGDFKHSFSAGFNPKTGQLSNLHTNLLSAVEGHGE
jgi:hypothetical protein